MKWYRQAVDKIILHLSTDKFRGLSKEQVRKRLVHDGYNVLHDVEPRSLLSIFFNQFKNPLIYILLVAAIIIFVVSDDKRDAFIISVVLFFNAVLGTIQEGRTRNIIESLKRFIKTESVVLRDGTKAIVEDRELVVGDVIFLQE